jgi:hypothetical protein
LRNFSLLSPGSRIVNLPLDFFQRRKLNALHLDTFKVHLEVCDQDDRASASDDVMRIAKPIFANLDPDTLFSWRSITRYVRCNYKVDFAVANSRQLFPIPYSTWLIQFHGSKKSHVNFLKISALMKL